VQSSIKETFVARLLERMEGIVAGDPLDPATNYGPLVSQDHLKKVIQYIEIAKQEGATLAIGGKRMDLPGFFIEPTVFTDVRDDMTIAKEEVFGPVMSLLTFHDEDEVIARANDTPYGLAAGVFSRDIARAHRVIGKIEAGTCWINTYNITPVEMPFGGIKQSGLGRENGFAGLDYYSQLKSVYVSTEPVEAAY